MTMGRTSSLMAFSSLINESFILEPNGIKTKFISLLMGLLKEHANLNPGGSLIVESFIEEGYEHCLILLSLRIRSILAVSVLQETQCYK